MGAAVVDAEMDEGRGVGRVEVGLLRGVGGEVGERGRVRGGRGGFVRDVDDFVDEEFGGTSELWCARLVGFGERVRRTTHDHERGQTAERALVDERDERVSKESVGTIHLGRSISELIARREQQKKTHLDLFVEQDWFLALLDHDANPIALQRRPRDPRLVMKPLYNLISSHRIPGKEQTHQPECSRPAPWSHP